MKRLRQFLRFWYMERRGLGEVVIGFRVHVEHAAEVHNIFQLWDDQRREWWITFWLRAAAIFATILILSPVISWVIG